MADNRFLHVDTPTWVGTYMGSVAKEGLQGPLICNLCKEQVETMEHMTNACRYNENLWKNHNQLFGVSDRNPNNMKTTMDNWRKKPYQNPILNRAWRLSLGFFLWAIWKERNNMIFKDERRIEEERWKQITQNI